MNTQKLLMLVCAALCFVVGAYVVLGDYARSTEQQKQKAFEDERPQVTEGAFAPQFESQESVPTATASLKAATPVTIAPKVNETPAPTPAPVPTTPPPTKNEYTKADVALHSGETSCWSIINAKVYDLTSYIEKHPGGERNILKICGKDGTSAFMGQHGGDSKPETTLAKHLLGPLTQ